MHILKNFIVLSSLALSLFGCGESTDTASPSKSGAETPTVRLGYFPNVTHAQALIGVQRGDFQKALGDKAKLEVSTFNAGPSVTEAIFAEELDLAYVGPSPALNGYVKSEGDEIRVVAGSGLNGVLIIGNKAKNITKLEDLRGKRLASPQLGNTQDISAKFFVIDHLKTKLKSEGGDTEVIPILNPDIETLLAKNDLDAAWVPEPWGSRLLQNGLGTLISEEKDLWPSKSFALTVIVARAEFLEKHPELVKQILTAHVGITTELQQNPDSFSEIINGEIKRLTSKSLPPEVIASSLKYTQFSTDPDRASFEEFYKRGTSLGIFKTGTQTLDKLIDTRILDGLTSGSKR